MKIVILQEKEKLTRLLAYLSSQKKVLLPGLINGIKVAATFAYTEWKKDVQNLGGKQEGWKEKYYDSIKINKTQNPLEAEVEASGLYANLVETGVRSRDMKPALTHGPKSRVSAKGVRYNIIFFRQGTPRAQHITPMPVNVYKEAKQMAKDDIKKRYRNIGALTSGEKIYSKGAQRYDTQKVEEKNQKGMMRMGSPRHSQYGTFRIVTENSIGWNYPAVPPRPVFQKLVQRIGPEIRKIVQDGLIDDLSHGTEFLSKQGSKWEK